jgi:hypothetical protein
MLVIVAFRLRELLFGHRAALRRCEHYTTPVSLHGRLHKNIGEVSLFKIAHTLPQIRPQKRC